MGVEDGDRGQASFSFQIHKSTEKAELDGTRCGNVAAVLEGTHYGKVAA